MGSDNNNSSRATPSSVKLTGLFVALLLVSLYNLNPHEATGMSSTSALIGNLETEMSGLKTKINAMEEEKSAIYKNLRVKQSALPLDSSSATVTGSPGKSPPIAKPPQPPQPAVTINTSPDGGPMQFYGAEYTPSPNIVDFPCPLRDYPDPTSCKLECEDETCSRAVKVCSSFVECTHIVYDGERGEDLSSKHVALKHEVIKEDLSALTAAFSKWSSVMTKDEKPRTYVIISYGGSGSKMLSGWISDLPKSSVVTVKHMHDPNPPSVMRGFNRPLREAR